MTLDVAIARLQKLKRILGGEAEVWIETAQAGAPRYFVLLTDRRTQVADLAHDVRLELPRWREQKNRHGEPDE